MDQIGPKRKFKGTEKLLIGCAVGCGVLVLGAVLAGSFGAYWFFSPGEQVATETIAGEESVGVVRMNELATDEGTQALLTKAIQTLDKVNRQQQEQALPESMKWLQAFQRSPTSKDLNQFIPKEATLVLEPGVDGGDPSFAVAVNFRTMVRPIKAMLALASRSEGQDLRSKYLGHDVYNFDEDAFVAFVGSTLLFSDTGATLERAIDRIEGTAPRRSTPVGGGLPEGNWDTTGSLANDEGVVVGVIHGLLEDHGFEPPAGEDAALDLRFGVDVVSADEIIATTHLDSDDAARATAWLAALKEHFPSIVGNAAEHGLELEIDAEVRGKSVVTDLRLTGLEALIENMIQVDFPTQEPSDENE